MHVLVPCDISLHLSSTFIVYTTTTSEQYFYILYTNSTSGQHFYISSEQHHIFYTTTSEQNFYILHHCYNWAALLSNRSQSELLSVRRSPGRSRNQRKTLFPHKSSNNQLRLCWDWSVLQKINLIWELCCDCRNFYLSISHRQPSEIGTVVWLFSWYWLISIGLPL